MTSSCALDGEVSDDADPTPRAAPDNTPRLARAAIQDTTPRPQPYTARTSMHIQVVHAREDCEGNL